MKTETQSVTGKVLKELSEREARLIDLLRSVEYGQVVVYLEKGDPVRVEELKKSIKL